MRIKALLFICLLNNKSYSQMKYDHFLPFYDSLSVPTYISISDTAKYFHPARTRVGSKIIIFDDANKIVGYYILENKHKWVFRKFTS